MAEFPRRRWFIGFVLEPTLVPQVHDQHFRDVNMRACWTFKAASRKARRWNGLRSAFRQPGTFEVFGPLGKGDD